MKTLYLKPEAETIEIETEVVCQSIASYIIVEGSFDDDSD